jgi:aryl-alcohol dehydrogenase-like predicted oxidoreductase
MQYRILGRTGISVSEVGFGAWGIGGGWGPTDDETSLRALRHAYDLGITFYDTAMGYGNGHSEQLIGQAFQGQRDQIVIASKVPPKNFRWPVKDSDPLETIFPAKWIIQCTERSLRNLGCDYLDLQQLHAWTNAYLEQDEWLNALQQLKQQGKVRAFGVSANDWDPYGAVNLVRSGYIDTVQVIYNIFEQRPEEQLFPAALEHNIGILARVPFEEGLLTGAFPPGYQFADDDWRKEWLTPDRLEIAQEKVQALEEFLTPDRPTLAALALKFCLSHPAVSTVIPGMRRLENVTANAAVSDGLLLPEDMRAALKEHKFIHGWFYPWSV